MQDWWAIASDAASAIATTGAVVVALWVAIRDGRQRDRDIRQRDDEKRDSEAAQARLVIGRRLKDGRLEIHNHSTAPVLDLAIQSLTLINRETHERMEALGVEVPDLQGMPVRLAKVVEPGEEVPIPVVWTKDVEPRALSESYGMDCVYQFTDAAGLRWERRNRLHPRRIIMASDATLRSGRVL